MSLRKVNSDDYELIVPLLEEFNSSSITREDWKNLFENHWNLQDNFYGYVIIEEEKAIGFMGCIISERNIHGQIETIGNLTSWIVKEEHRNKSLRLLFPFLREHSFTITSFTASAGAYKIFARLGFKSFETTVVKFLGAPLYSKASKPFALLDQEQQITSILDKENKKIFNDHKKFVCHHLVLCKEDQWCYLVFTKKAGKKFGAVKLRYVSNCDLFKENFLKVKSALFGKLKTTAIYIDQRFLPEKKSLLSKTKVLRQPMLYKSSTLKPEDIDYLYSELILLGN